MGKNFHVQWNMKKYEKVDIYFFEGTNKNLFKSSSLFTHEQTFQKVAFGYEKVVATF